jgi:serine/threonine protein phosphatase PrpC
MQTRPGIEMAIQSDVGCRRENNEDYSFYWEPDSDPDFQHKGRLAIIADGMGGYEGGQEASRLAVETVLAVYEREADAGLREALIKGFQTAHDRIRQYAEDHPELQGMGTTCTAVVLRDHQLFFAHVGDSRLYLVRGDSIARLTHDHSYVGRLVESGILRAEEAESHPQRHILTAALGAGMDVSADAPVEPLNLEPGDAIVLCTDGLWSLVEERELHEVVRSHSPAAACAELVRMARDRGGPDNITLQVLRISPNGTT